MNIDLLPGETLGILGEPGCGKSSAGRAIMQEPSPTAGSVRLLDHELTGLKIKPLRKARSRMQMIMQDPVSSLNPRRRVRDLVAEGLARSEEHTSELQSLMRISYAVFCWKKQNT